MRFFLFPGQGSQKPGMGHDFFEHSPVARATFDEAASLLPEGFLETVFSGQPDEVNDTRVAQPGLLVVEVAMARHLIAQGVLPVGCAGHSLGEITALVVAGALAFEDAIPFVQERARLMSENVPEGGMAAVLGLHPDDIAAALPADVQIANFNTPEQTIISGTRTGIEQAGEALKAAGAKRVMPLSVSGPFHSDYMIPAAQQLEKMLADIALSEPLCPFVSSVSGAVETDPHRMRLLLAQQLYSPVLWTSVMDAIDSPCLEVGPGKVLAGLAKRIEGAPEVTPVATLAEAAAL